MVPAAWLAQPAVKALGAVLAVIAVVGIIYGGYRLVVHSFDARLEAALEADRNARAIDALEDEVARKERQGAAARTELEQTRKKLEATREHATRLDALLARDWNAELQADPDDFLARANAATERMRIRAQEALGAGAAAGGVRGPAPADGL